MKYRLEVNVLIKCLSLHKYVAFHHVDVLTVFETALYVQTFLSMCDFITGTMSNAQVPVGECVCVSV